MISKNIAFPWISRPGMYISSPWLFQVFHYRNHPVVNVCSRYQLGHKMPTNWARHCFTNTPPWRATRQQAFWRRARLRLTGVRRSERPHFAIKERWLETVQWAGQKPQWAHLRTIVQLGCKTVQLYGEIVQVGSPESRYGLYSAEVIRGWLRLVWAWSISAGV